MRIVSLLPSATEIICALGLRNSLVGVSHECDFPRGVDALPAVTSSTIASDLTSHEIDNEVRDQLQASTALYTLDLDLLQRLQPDLIVTQALCDVCAVSADDVEAALFELPGRPQIVNLEPAYIDDVFETITLVGAAADISDAAIRLNKDLRSRIARVREIVAEHGASAKRIAQLEWLDPLFDAGHWTPQLIEIAGGISVTGKAGEPSRTLQWSELVEARPDVIFVACCGFGVARTLKDIPLLLENPAWPAVASSLGQGILVADGNHYFNRPGPRLIDSLEIIADALHPNAKILPEGATHRALHVASGATH